MQNAKLQTSSAQSKMQGASNGRLWLTAQISRQKVVSIGRYCSDQYRPLCVWGNLCNFVCQKKATREIQTKLSTYYKEKKEDKNMQVTATVKIMGEEASGISAQTGNPWKSRMILLEWNDTEGTNRIWCALFNAKLEAFCQSGIGVGDTVLVSVRFTARTYRTGFFRTEAEIMTICKA